MTTLIHYALVARIPYVRVLMSLASLYDIYTHQIDIKIAFLNGNLTKGNFIKQHEGFVLPDTKKKVSKLIKVSLWFETSTKIVA